MKIRRSLKITIGLVPALISLIFLGHLNNYVHNFKAKSLATPLFFKTTGQQHIDSINKTLDLNKVESPIAIVGHSMGAHVALALAAQNLRNIKALVLISPPIFHSRDDAIKKLKSSSPYSAIMGFHPVLAPVICSFHEALIPILRPLMPLWLSEFPLEVAKDAVLHTWNSYQISVEILLATDWTALAIALKGKLLFHVEFFIHGVINLA